MLGQLQPNSINEKVIDSMTRDGDSVERDLVLVHPLGSRLHIGKVDKTERTRATCSDSSIRAGHIINIISHQGK
ncbi:hypothetical protein Y032_0155g3054 [Ancylostoma ceylanicum]|uniref:Uncharacterized protein n=1 Tax=Ancylostoma ceylanicum TaxID=53326 RepID=A0A016SZI1_9BILA|nr:hypothetical protein Y032_0155g3054 [Ancylostoma ceylanicum]